MKDVRIAVMDFIITMEKRPVPNADLLNKRSITSSGIKKDLRNFVQIPETIFNST